MTMHLAGANESNKRGSGLARAAFLDRDGVINEKPREGEYVTSWANFHFLPGIGEAIALLNRADFSVIVVTNQRCTAKGLMTVAELEQIHQRMTESLACAGAVVDGIYFCPHELDASCLCRKPAPGMLLEASRTRGIDLRRSWMIGDSDIDIEAGKNAGCRTARISLTTTSNNASADAADIVAPSVLDAVREILHLDGISTDSVTKGSAVI